MRVLLTGSAGFIGTAVGEVLEADGHEVVRVDLMLPMAHGSAEPPAGTHHLDVRDAAAWVDLLRGVDAVCHQAAVVGAGVRVGDLPEYAGHNDLGTAALLAAMHEAGVDRLVLASSMVVYGEGRYRCPEHGDQTPPPREVDALVAGDFENHCPRCERPLDWALVEEDARLDPRSSYAASKVAQEHYTSAWVRQAGARAVALRYHNVYGPGMPRDTPYSGVAALFRSSLERGEPPQVFEDGGQARDFVHVADVARANLAALRAVTDDATPAVRRLQRRLRAPGPDPRRGHAGGSGHRPRDRARRDRRLPARRRPARRRLAGAGDRRARLHRRGPPRPGAAGVRDRAAARPDHHDSSAVRRVVRAGQWQTNRVSPRRVEQVLHQQRRDHLGRQPPPPPTVGQQREGHGQPRHERQPDPLHLGLAHA